MLEKGGECGTGLRDWFYHFHQPAHWLSGCTLSSEGQPLPCNDELSLLLVLHLANCCYVPTIGGFFFLLVLQRGRAEPALRRQGDGKSGLHARSWLG